MIIASLLLAFGPIVLLIYLIATVGAKSGSLVNPDARDDAEWWNAIREVLSDIEPYNHYIHLLSGQDLEYYLEVTKLVFEQRLTVFEQFSVARQARKKLGMSMWE